MDRFTALVRTIRSAHLRPEAAVRLAERVRGAAAARQIRALRHAPVPRQLAKPENT